MSVEEQKTVVKERKARGLPWHTPPHFGGEEAVYLISAACFEHRDILTTPARLTEFAEALVSSLKDAPSSEIHVWVVQPNHYHLLGRFDLDTLRPRIARLHNGKSTQWNREDKTPGRKVWHGFSDRLMRSEGHYYGTLNYIHGNPVKHGYVKRAANWPWSSLHEYLAEFGSKRIAEWWRRYPVDDYGKGWDD